MQDQHSIEITPITKRYNDAYTLARFQTGLGTTIKLLALIIGGFVTLVCFLYTISQSVPQRGLFGPTTNEIGMAFGFVGMVGGVLIAGIGWVYGSSISAQGQVLKAVLDTAVNTSPFLDNAGRATMMSISR
jgi:hypothetical protein